MYIDERADLAPGGARQAEDLGDGREPSASQPLGRLIAVSGSQATMQFAAEQSPVGG